MRTINELIIHCSATPEGRDVGAAEIRQWHKAQGYADIGYHFIIRLDGRIEPGRDINLAGAHCRGHNSHSIGICYIGGLDSKLRAKDTRTSAQRHALRNLVAELKLRFPGVRVHGHREFAAKACPCFDVTAEF
ncbi:MAG: N-acetylmuramoyl-L-alanine amidase [Paramuribaculum sp.]|nr:N-acetylmuramoyl-L-alanine amidase [Paramuribaculum sp.]